MQVCPRCDMLNAEPVYLHEDGEGVCVDRSRWSAPNALWCWKCIEAFPLPALTVLY